MSKKISLILIIIAIILALSVPPVEMNSTKPEVPKKEEIQKIEPAPTKTKILKKAFAKEDTRQDLINYAYSKGGKDFVLTLDGENGEWTANRKSNIIGANGYWDYGICQLNKKYHKDFINSKEFADPYKQIDYCYNVFSKALAKGKIKTTFYAYNHRHKCAKRFENL